jgi:hypothetical protein
LRLTIGEILSHPENSVPQTIVLRYLEIGSVQYCVRNSEAMVLFLSKEYLDRNKTFFRCFSHNLYPISLLRNTMVFGTLFSGGLRISPHCLKSTHSIGILNSELQNLIIILQLQPWIKTVIYSHWLLQNFSKNGDSKHLDPEQ